MDARNNIEVGDVVQIGDSDFGWSGSLMVVMEVAPWGVDGVVMLNETTRRLRPTWDMIEYVGKAVWMPQLDIADEGNDDLADRLGCALSDYDIEED